MTERTEPGRITVTVEPARVSVAFIGEFDDWNSHTLAAQVPVSGGRAVLVDLSGVTFGSSAFLRELIELQRKVHSDGAGFQITSVSPVLARLLTMTGLDALLDTQPQPDAQDPSSARPS